MLLRRISKHIKDQNWQNKTTSLRGALATWHQTAGQPFCHAKRPEGGMAGAIKQSLKSDANSNRLPRSFLPRNDSDF